MSARFAIQMSTDASFVEPPVPRTPATRLISGSPRIRSTSRAGVVLRAGGFLSEGEQVRPASEGAAQVSGETAQ